MSGRPRLAAGTIGVALLSLLASASTVAATPASPTTAAGATVAPKAVPAPVLPDAPGKAVLERVCSMCHPISMVVEQKRSVDQWTQILNQMLDRGAQATDEEQQQIFAYLVRYYGTSQPDTTP